MTANTHGVQLQGENPIPLFSYFPVGSSMSREERGGDKRLGWSGEDCRASPETFGWPHPITFRCKDLREVNPWILNLWVRFNILVSIVAAYPRNYSFCQRLWEIPRCNFPGTTIYDTGKVADRGLP